MLILTIDIGSSSLRSMVFAADGRPFDASMARSERRFQSSRDGSAVDDPVALLEDLAGCIDQSLHALGERQAELATVAIASYAPTLIGLDAANRPLTPLISYADTRSAPDAAALRRELDEREIFERTGCPLRSNYLPARLRWLRRSQPELFRQVRRWVSLGEYLALQWLDSAAPSMSLAAWGGLLNRHTLQWDEPLLAFLDVEPQQLLPPVDPADTAQLRAGMAGRWPALAGIPWLPAIGDGAAANIGSDCCDARRAALTVGTSAALRVTLSDGPQSLPWGLWCYRVDRRRALLGGASSEGGNLFKWLRNVLRIDAAELETVLEQRSPAAHGLAVLPFIAGERSPGWADAASAVFSGISVSTDAYDLAQAGLEAVAYRFALIAAQLESALTESPAYIANGGALQNSPAWCRIFADVLNRPLHVHPADETTARGLALLAAEILGQPLEACPPIDFLRIHEPDAERHERYRAALEGQQELYRRLLG